MVTVIMEAIIVLDIHLRKSNIIIIEIIICYNLMI